MDEATLVAKRARLAELNRKRLEEQNAKLEEMLAPYKATQPSAEELDFVQFRHDSYFGRTYAVVSPSPEDLENSLVELLGGNKTPSVPFKVGISRLNPADKDQYSKYVGRVVSAAKMETRSLTITGAFINDKQVSYSAVMDGIHFEFLLTHGKVRPFLYQIYDDSLRTSYAERAKIVRG